MRITAVLLILAVLAKSSEAQYRPPYGPPGRGSGSRHVSPYTRDPRHSGHSGHSRHPGQGPGRGPRPGGQGCGGWKQPCCRSSQPCQPQLQCRQAGDRAWFSAVGRCVPKKTRHECGLEGMDCCRRDGAPRCFGRLECAANMCRNPTSAVDLGPPEGVVGQTTVSASGWLMVKVLARGGKCFVKIRGNLNVNVESLGEGTFGEVFGDLSGIGECAENAEGFAVGYIRADVMSSATKTEDGDCITEADAEVEAQTKVKGDGITIGVGGDFGTTVGCNRRLLKGLDFIPL